MTANGSVRAVAAAIAAVDGSVKSLTRLANSENEIRSLDAIEKLRRVGTDDAVRALEGLSAGANNRLAMRALSGLARSGSSDAEQKMLNVFRDANRADVVRAMALTLWCRSRATDGAGWEELRGTIEAGACDERAAARGVAVQFRIDVVLIHDPLPLSAQRRRCDIRRCRGAESHQCSRCVLRGSSDLRVDPVDARRTHHYSPARRAGTAARCGIGPTRRVR